MLALFLAVNLAAVPPPPQADPLSLGPGPFRPSVVTAGAVGATLGDVLVVGLGWGTLQLFANGALEPTAEGFRNAAIGLAVAGVVIPPLTAALLARWSHGGGRFWRSALLALGAQVAALGVGYLAWPHAWVFLPAQALGVGVTSAIGLGARGRPAALGGGAAASAPPSPGLQALRPGLATPVCPAG